MKVRHVDRLRKKIEAMPKIARDEIRKALAASGEEMVDLARRAAPKKTGALANSIGYTFGDYKPDNANVRGVGAGGGGHDLAVTVHAGDAKAFYAAFVEFGTRAHLIEAQPGSALGKDGVFGEKVEHPGGQASPFFFPAYRLTKKRAKSRLSRAVRQAAIKASKLT